MSLVGPGTPMNRSSLSVLGQLHVTSHKKLPYSDARLGHLILSSPFTDLTPWCYIMKCIYFLHLLQYFDPYRIHGEVKNQRFSYIKFSYIKFVSTEDQFLHSVAVLYIGGREQMTGQERDGKMREGRER